jgi:hypothetical protein
MPAAVGGDVGEGVDIEGALEVVEAVESFSTAGVSVVDVMVDLGSTCGTRVVLGESAVIASKTKTGRMESGMSRAGR